jgi:hypothetical protein
MDTLRINDFSVKVFFYPATHHNGCRLKTKRGRRVSWSVRAAPPVEDSETFGNALEMPRDAGKRQKYAARATGEL